MAVVLIIAIGMLCVVLTGEIDLSVGSSAALAGVACAWMLIQTNSQLISILFALLVGVGVEVFNGYLSVYQKSLPLLSLWHPWRFSEAVCYYGQTVNYVRFQKGFHCGGQLLFGIIPVSTIISLSLIV